MAEEKKPGQGWEKNTDNTFKATLSIPKKPSAVVQTASSSRTSQNTNQPVRVIVNNETGAIQLYEVRGIGVGDRLFNTFNPSTGKWESPSNDPQAFNQIQNRIGTDGIQKLQNEAKKGAINGVINPTSTNENKAKITSTEGYKSLSNTINQDPNEEQVGTVGAESFKQSEISQEIGAGNLRDSYGHSKYPLKMKSEDQDCIKFTMYEYKPKTFELTSGLGAFSGSNNKGRSFGTVTLPIQPQISDSNSVTWGEDSINALQAAAAAAAYGAITGQGTAQTLDEIYEGIKSQQNNIKTTLAAGFAAKAVGANENFLSRTTGAILNNNVELLFQGPSLRSFSFTFLMSAREPDETKEIIKIIRFFKQGMSVKRTTDGNLFLKAPNVFDIEYLHKNSPHKYINKIKTCALQNCSVNYTPDGNYATYGDGSMTQYSLTLSFSEIDPLYDDDYSKTDDGIIGY